MYDLINAKGQLKHVLLFLVVVVVNIILIGRKCI